MLVVHSNESSKIGYRFSLSLMEIVIYGFFLVPVLAANSQPEEKAEHYS